jgi:hypothetical protein
MDYTLSTSTHRNIFNPSNSNSTASRPPSSPHVEIEDKTVDSGTNGREITTTISDAIALTVEANIFSFISLTVAADDLFIDVSFSVFSVWRCVTSKERVVCSISLYRRDGTLTVAEIENKTGDIGWNTVETVAVADYNGSEQITENTRKNIVNPIQCVLRLEVCNV